MQHSCWQQKNESELVMAVLNQSTNALQSEHCWQEEGGVILWERGQSMGRWMAQGRAAHSGELPHQTEENPLQSGKQASGLCYNRGEENNWHLLEFSPHLLLAKNAPENLEGITSETRKTIWPNLLQSNCWPLSWKALSTSTCANTSGAWAPTHTSTQTGQGQMVVHLSLVSLIVLANTDTWKAGGKVGRDPSSFCREETSSKSTKIPEKGNTCAAIRAVFSGFRRWLKELKGTIIVLHLTLATQRKQSTGA